MDMKKESEILELIQMKSRLELMKLGIKIPEKSSNENQNSNQMINEATNQG